MKIRKFNESTDEEFDIDYIQQCFAELSDEYDFKIREVKSERKYIQIEIKLPRLNSEIVLTDDEIGNSFYALKNTLPNLIKNSEELTKILKLAKISIARLLDEYPNYAITFKEIDDNLRTKVQYVTKSNGDEPKLFVTICKK